jgi:DNA-binding response OmpR family regulator
MCNEPPSGAVDVLIVDDDAQLAFGVSRRLEAVGYATRTAGSGEQGLAAAHDVVPDVVLLDVMMPGMDGLTALQRLRTDRRTSHVPVIMLSASLGDERDALDAGAKYFLKKPYSHEHLFAAVTKAVQASRQASCNI